MFKFGSSVSLAATRAGMLIVSSVFLNELTATRFLAQEGPPTTEEERQAREALNQGVQAFKNGQYDEAIVEFQRAKLSDPKLMNARLYLATVYASQYIPGLPVERNREFGRKAVEEFRGVLEIDPQNLSAIDGVGSILFQMASTPFDPEKFKESKSYHQKHIELRPDDPEPYYWVGVIDWTLSFCADRELRAQFNQGNRRAVRDNDPLPADIRKQYASEYGAIIDEGIASMKRAIALRPDYDDAMAYLNLLYRRKADAVADASERSDLLLMADYLVDRIKEIKQKRAEQPPRP